MTKATTNVAVKSYLTRACNIENEIDTLKEDRKELNSEMKASGVDMKAFAAALKEIRKPVDADLKIKANQYLEEYGQYKLFA